MVCTVDTVYTPCYDRLIMNNDWTDTKDAVARLQRAAYLVASERPVNSPALDILYNAVEHLIGSLGLARTVRIAGGTYLVTAAGEKVA
jgi:hypothetical protein